MKEDFERDLDDYLQARKRARFDIKRFLKQLVPEKQPARVDVPEDVEVYEQQDQPAQQPKGQPFLKKFFKKEDAEELARSNMKAEDAIADLKEVSKITLNIIKELPDDNLMHVKQSPDFERLKTILKKHDLIK